MSDSSDDEVVVPRPSRKRRKLVPDATGEESGELATAPSGSLTSLSSDFLTKDQAIQSGAILKTKKTTLDVIRIDDDATKNVKNRPRPIFIPPSSSSDDDDDVPSRSRSNRSPSPPQFPATASIASKENGRGTGRGRRKRKSTQPRRSAKVNKGLKAVQELRSMHNDLMWRDQLAAHQRDLVECLDTSLVRESQASSSSILVKVRTASGVQRVLLEQSESFAKVFAAMAETEKCDVARIALTLADGRDVRETDTPAELRLTIADIVECVVIRDDVSEGGDEKEENISGDDRINLKIQSLDSKLGQFVVVRVKPSDPLETMMTEAAAALGVEDSSTLSFRFDGETIDPRSTALGHEMEDDDCIDVVFRK